MTEEQQAIYDEGYDEGRLAFELGSSEHSNPYTGLDAEYWSDGYEDALEDDAQR